MHGQLTHSMVQSPSWAANWFAASQEIPRISRNPKVHYRTHKRPPHVSILGQPNPVHMHGQQNIKKELVLYAFFWVIQRRLNWDAGELSRRKHTTFRTRRKFEIKGTGDFRVYLLQTEPRFYVSSTRSSSITINSKLNKLRKSGVTLRP